MSDEKFKHIGTKYVRLAEECSEVIQMCCKIERFGEDGYNPYDEQKTSNIVKLKYEIQDLLDILHNDFKMR